MSVYNVGNVRGFRESKRYNKESNSFLAQVPKGVLFSFILLFIALSIQLYVRLSVIHKSYDLERLRVDTLKADSELRELEVVYAVTSKPLNVKMRSKKTLGLDITEPSKVRRMNKVLS